MANWTTSASAPSAPSWTRSSATRKVRHLVLDLTGVSFMDSSAIGLVIGRYKALSRRGGRVSVAGATPRVDRIFEMAGLYTIVEKLA